jgi:RNA ligase
MHYQFPVIRNIDDVLPHIEGRDEFVVAERDYGTIINYAVAFEDTFPPIKVAGGSARMRAERALTNAMRRECRGLIFYPNGIIMSRSFHKFFNLGEREETLPDRIDLSQPHVVMEKLDGSMIRPVVADGYVRLGTKMGVTEVSMNAETWLTAQSDYNQKMLFLQKMIAENKTPIFEWCSRKNQIVLDYPNDNLILTAVRDNFTGEYLPFGQDVPFDVVPVYGSLEGNLADYISKHRADEGREGFIIRFIGGESNGQMFKGKNDWYVRIHKVLDRVRFDRHIVELILTEKLDDAAPLLPQHESDRVREFADRFGKQLHQLVEKYERYWNTVAASGLDRKRYAQEWMPTIKSNDPFAVAYVFGRFGDRDGRTMILDHIQKHTSTNTKWNECAKWMGLTDV